ncbi:hypothetical protein J41TS12_17690 [Paenibacillus antibioticophila]|uniref:Uncharacterized protein n=1 Tax=Paenibacillus antibioticophila TaxID=1274374 RepID=A0A919XST0_9BACL|nr:hypothetical protein [Paenibacillus antibioticophila]GIO36908.1 hypothetical protein J41TS12_17690 [Paenibacillus antibioticophila]
MKTDYSNELGKLRAGNLITRREHILLELLLAGNSKEEIARVMGIQHDGVLKRISKLLARGVLVKSGEEVSLTADHSTIVVKKRKQGGPRHQAPETINIAISEDERSWMLANYDSCNRPAAVKALGRSKYDINMMAAAMGLDRRG